MTGETMIDKLNQDLAILYPGRDVSDIISSIRTKIEELKSTLARPSLDSRWDERDVILITYGDTIREGNELPLKTLNAFLENELKETVTIVHLLPFFPYSSDDGFSIIDYRVVNPDLGEWKEVEKIADTFRLMADLVINHGSSKGSWFKAYRKGTPPFSEYFLEGDPQKDYSAVVRPRSHPLLTAFATFKGKKFLWTTFSADQIDFNFKSPGLLTAMLDILFFYLSRGIQIVRLDAIAFLWKEEDTNCMHLPQTHALVRLIRTIFDAISPHFILLTETNVPDKENRSYFGTNDEAHMVYQFVLPPLILHALHRGNASFLSHFVNSIPFLGKDQTYLNFTASHDGIGLRPLEGILPAEEIEILIHKMKENGALISEKASTDGSKSPYEINITYFDACKSKADNDQLQIARFLCSQTITLSLQGIPAFYIQSFLASTNDRKGYERTKQKRSVNRKKWDYPEIRQILKSNGTSKFVFNELKRRIKIRRKESLFSPQSDQKVLAISPNLFVIKRVKASRELLAVVNVTGKMVSLTLEKKLISSPLIRDLLSNNVYQPNGTVNLTAYQCCWFIGT